MKAYSVDPRPMMAVKKASPGSLQPPWLVCKSPPPPRPAITRHPAGGVKATLLAGLDGLARGWGGGGGTQLPSPRPHQGALPTGGLPEVLETAGT